ncbi:cytochrome c oxidase assembly protein subunit 11 [Paragonimus westermani]|uniref:Cytochrome c oxidase assembly protein COX11, mitochondrial n=1 Tax=Paragonimus westermani TaxID=34504 RepID=A0A5J4NDR5_9TREM|nr:cytochrome c oxidase assembly protein subunit 11 [Paragonimus westermani]
MFVRKFTRLFGPHHFFSSRSSRKSYESRTFLYYGLSMGITMLGVGYAGVPLYRIYCSRYSSGTNVEFARAKSEDIRNMKPVRDRQITVYFSADTYSNMAWNFKPVQTQLTVVPGETALAFYSAENPTDEPIIGIATYTIVPPEASKYFNKIQCFCFEEQRLNPYEKVDMPVFFYLDPEFAEDPKLFRANHIILHYTFFQARREKLSIPGIRTTNIQPVTS